MQEKFEIILKKSSILLAEDEISVSESFQRVLLLYVDKVYTATDGQEAYEMYEKHAPDILITDIKMPKINGIELVKKIRQTNNDIPIIVTSAYTNQDFLLDSIKLSLVDYIVKPLKSSDLNRLLEDCAKRLLSKEKTIVNFENECSYHYENKIFTHNNQSVSFTPKEVEFFELLLAHRGTLVTKAEIESKLYIYEDAPLSALKNLVFKLRKKLGVDLIKTVKQLGYMIE